MTAKPTTMRLDRLLANMGYGSRREIDILCRRGSLWLDGNKLTDAGQRLALTADLPQRLWVDGEPLDPLPGMAILLHKPAGLTCSHTESPNVYSLLPDRWRQRDPAISSVGRLDKDTSGLLLLTDDGALNHRVTSPRHHVPKRYRVTLTRPLDGSEAEAFKRGDLMLDNETTPLFPAELEAISPTEAYLTIHEGRYHQVKRMFVAIGNHVEALHRDRLGELDLPDDLPPGQFRVIGAPEIEQLFGRQA